MTVPHSKFLFFCGHRVHRRVHQEDKPHRCNHDGCDKAFKTPAELSRHAFRHTGEKPHKCDQCDKAFIRYDDLKRHYRIHTGTVLWTFCDVHRENFETWNAGLIIHSLACIYMLQCTCMCIVGRFYTRDRLFFQMNLSQLSASWSCLVVRLV